MGILPGLIQGLTTGATGALQGVERRKLLEQQALHQRLQDELLKAQTDYFQHRATTAATKPGTKLQHLQDPVTGAVYSYDPASGTVTPATMAPSPGTLPTAPTPGQQPGAAPPKKVLAKLGVKPSRPIAGTDRQGNTVLIDPNTHQVMPVAGAGKPITAVERETNAAARTALSLIGEMKSLRRQSATAGRLPLGTALARAPGRLPVVGEAAKGLMEPIAQQFMTPQQAAYQQKADQLLHLASSVLPKGGRSIALLQNLRASFTAPALAKNPRAAEEALDELEQQVTEVLGGAPGPAAAPAFQFKYHRPK